MQAIISDTSCLILLDKIGVIFLLQKFYGEVITTKIVADEFGKQLPAWISIQNSSNANIQLALEVTLDKGEASTIALALEQKDCLLIIDELRGRRLAKQFGLNITETLGVLIQVKLNGYLPAIKPLLDKIKQTDFRLSEQLVKEALKQAGA